MLVEMIPDTARDDKNAHDNAPLRDSSHGNPSYAENSSQSVLTPVRDITHAHPSRLIQLRDVTFTYDRAKRGIVRRVNLDIHAGEALAITGPSGVGKSTLLRIIAGLVQPSQGTVTRQTGRDGRHTRCAMMFQQNLLLPWLSVANNVRLSARLSGRTTGHTARPADMIASVGLAGLDDRLPHELSGGQRQRVALARALAQDPDVLLLDEPFSSLDQGLAQELRDLVRDMIAHRHISLVLVTHNPQEAEQLADRIITLSTDSDGLHEQPGGRCHAECGFPSSPVAPLIAATSSAFT